MSKVRRQVAHERVGRLTCSCGARFKSGGDLRKHLAQWVPEVPGRGEPAAPRVRQRKKFKGRR